MVREITTKIESIAKLCDEYEVQTLELFGSAATGDFNPESSDFDFLVELRRPVRRNVVDQYFGLKGQLEELLGRRVDLVEKSQVTNPFVIQQIQRQRTPLYAA